MADQKPDKYKIWPKILPQRPLEMDKKKIHFEKFHVTEMNPLAQGKFF